MDETTEGGDGPRVRLGAEALGGLSILLFVALSLAAAAIHRKPPLEDYANRVVIFPVLPTPEPFLEDPRTRRVSAQPPAGAERQGARLLAALPQPEPEVLRDAPAPLPSPAPTKWPGTEPALGGNAGPAPDDWASALAASPEQTLPVQSAPERGEAPKRKLTFYGKVNTFYQDNASTKASFREAEQRHDDDSGGSR